MKKLLYLIIGVVLLMACSERQEYVRMLEQAKTLMHDEPDSALMIINSLGQHEAEFGKSFRKSSPFLMAEEDLKFQSS